MSWVQRRLTPFNAVFDPVLSVGFDEFCRGALAGRFAQ